MSVSLAVGIYLLSFKWGSVITRCVQGENCYENIGPNVTKVFQRKQIITSVKPEKDRQSRMHLYKNCLEISWLEKGNNF